MKAKILGIAGAALLVAALLVGLTGIVLAGEQTWYLNDTTTTPGYEMDRMSLDPTSSSVAVANAGSALWISNEVAEVDVEFCADDWLTDLYFMSAPTGSMTVYIGSWNATAGFTTAASQTFSGDGSHIRYQPTISASAFTLIAADGDYLAFKFDNNTGSSVSLDTGGVQQSRVSGPPCDPGFPTPELSTIILTSAGLAALGGFIWLRRRKAATTQA